MLFFGSTLLSLPTVAQVEGSVTVWNLSIIQFFILVKVSHSHTGQVSQLKDRPKDLKAYISISVQLEM